MIRRHTLAQWLVGLYALGTTIEVVLRQISLSYACSCISLAVIAYYVAELGEAVLTRHPGRIP